MAARRVLPPHLDHAGEGVEALHEGERTGGAAAAGQHGILLPQGREIGARARSPFEQHAFGLGEVENGFERIPDGDDEAGGALRPQHAGFELGDAIGLLVVDPAVAARFLDPHIEPDRRVEAGLLGEHQVGEFGAEIFTVGIGLEIAVLLAPIGDSVHHALDQLGHAGLAVRRPELAVKVLAGDDIGGGLRPVHGHFDIALLEDDGALVVADGSGAGLPLNLIVGGFARFEPGGEKAREGNPALALVVVLVFNNSIFALRSTDNCPISQLLSGSLQEKHLRKFAPIYSGTSRILSI